MRAITNIVTSGGGINSTLTVTCSDDFIGETLTCTNGTKSITKTVPLSMNVVFNLSSAGTWVLSNSLTPETSSYVVENIEYNKTLSNVPDGKTVLPTDDIQTWLNCADIWDKEYTTLAEVLADKDTLVKFMASDNAVDYLVRSTTWAVSSALVPKMTSDTTLLGECICDSYVSGENAYKAFDKNNSTYWESSIIGTTGGQWIGYKFTSPQRINYLINRSSAGATNYVKVQYSDDGNTWVDTGDTYTIINTDGDKKVSVTSGAAHLYYRIYCTSASSNTRLATTELQFYSASIADSEAAMQYIGQNNYAANTLLADEDWCNAICNSEYFESVLNVKVPTMTGYTTPEGEVSTKSESGSYLAWKAFDRNDSTYWQTADNALPQWIQYKFVSSVKVYLASAWWGVRYPTQLKIQGSNDNSTWTDLTEMLSGTGATTTNKYVISSPSNYLYYRLNIIQVNASPYNVYSNAIQFYGREDV